MADANPGLRPGLSSAIPTGLDSVTVVLTHPLKPRFLLGFYGPTEVVPDTKHFVRHPSDSLSLAGDFPRLEGSDQSLTVTVFTSGCAGGRAEPGQDVHHAFRITCFQEQLPDAERG